MFSEGTFVDSCQLDLAQKKNKYIKKYRLSTKNNQMKF